jgi:hypothetical protein
VKACLKSYQIKDSTTSIPNEVSGAYMNKVTLIQSKGRPVATVENIKSLLMSKGVEFYLDHYTLVMRHEGINYSSDRLRYQIREFANIEGFKITDLTQAIKFALDDISDELWEQRRFNHD